MLSDPRKHPLRDYLRAWLGTDRLSALEAHMSDWLTTLNGLVAQTTEASAAQQASFLNLHNALNRQAGLIADLRGDLAQALKNGGQVTPEMQATVNELAQALDDMKKAAVIADDGFEPVEEPEPTPEAPAEPVPDEAPIVETPDEGIAQRR